MKTRRVVVTGIGAVTAIGLGRQGLWEGVLRSKSAVRTVQRFDPSPYRAHMAAEVDMCIEDHLDRKQIRRLDRFAQASYGKRVLELAIRWTLDQPFVTVALWGARHPEQLTPIAGTSGWTLDASAMRAIGEIARESITDPVGPEFMAPPARSL